MVGSIFKANPVFQPQTGEVATAKERQLIAIYRQQTGADAGKLPPMNGKLGAPKWWRWLTAGRSPAKRQILPENPEWQRVTGIAPVGNGQPGTEPLAGQPVGRRLKIVGFQLPLDIYQRLLEMGLTKGTECAVMRYAPMGGPIELKVRGYSLSLRLAEAAGVQVSCP